MNRRSGERDEEPSQLRRLVATIGDRCESQDAASVLRWAGATFGTRLCATSSMTDAVVVHLLSRHAPGTDVLFLDTGEHFAETLEYRRQIEETYPLRVVDVRWDRQPGQQPRPGPEATREFEVDPDSCCRRRKVVPLRLALGSYDAWVTGIRRVETENRASTPILSWDEVNQVVKIAPIAAWTDEEVEAYAARFDLPRHPLTQLGFTSIGCAPCTALPGSAGPRSGRWLGWPKAECGLHAR